MEKRYQVFISSTFKDLEEERQKVMKAILDEECFPAGMEMFPASDNEQFQFIKTVIDKSDYYVLIIAGKYGSLAEDGIGYTEKEYDYAIKKGIPVLVFIHRNPDQLPSIKTEKNSDLIHKLENFKKKVSNGRLRSQWESGDELKNEVGKALRKAFSTNPRPGWIRATEKEFSVISSTESNSVSMLRKKDYVKEAEEYFSSKGINLNGGYTEQVGTNLISGIDELEQGRVLAFTPINYDILDNNVWYYYNVNNKVGYKYLKGKWEKVVN